MPRSSKALQQKPSSLTDDQGWTHVIRGAHNIRKPTKTPSLNDSPNISPAKVTEGQQRYAALWSSSACCHQLRMILEQEIPLTHNLQMDKCVCLGLGSFTDGRTSSKHQLATLTWMLGILSQKHTFQAVLFQDPAFTASDVAYLESLGHHVLESPLAFDQIDESTFLFAPHLEANVYAAALEKKVPALVVGSNVTELIGRPISSGVDEAQRVRENSIFCCFSDLTLSEPMPQYDRDTWCYYTNIYRRQDMRSERSCDHS
ncbi:uncharacterized protein KY384_000637 [Bacidia gigantensis]|uniref:uncharacterized protein n=1 Tax=Bacidia gigantensis TaxID=2732470 RepID=UPI001D050915|nr:uncharacterized protein KY384_000637 [Bacidia gigantensis]KAG8525877.1 hypothetical protein KY384_000637 [Bacidia gigantensis]